MFTKMRAVLAAEKQRADATAQEFAEYRQRVEEERRQERETFMAMLAEERQQAAEERAAFRNTLSDMMAQFTQLMERQNGNGQSGP